MLHSSLDDLVISNKQTPPCLQECHGVQGLLPGEQEGRQTLVWNPSCAAHGVLIGDCRLRVHGFIMQRTNTKQPESYQSLDLYICSATIINVSSKNTNVLVAVHENVLDLRNVQPDPWAPLPRPGPLQPKQSAFGAKLNLWNVVLKYRTSFILTELSSNYWEGFQCVWVDYCLDLCDSMTVIGWCC